MIQLAQNAESQELSDALEKLGQEAARLQTVIDTVPSFLWTSLPDGSKEYGPARRSSAAPVCPLPDDWRDRPPGSAARRAPLHTRRAPVASATGGGLIGRAIPTRVEPPR